MRIYGAFLLGILAPAAGMGATFTAVRSLSFGTLIPTASGGSVVVGINSSINTNGSATVAPSGTGYYSGVAEFEGTGLSNVANVLTTTFLSSSVTLTNGTGGTVTVGNFTITPNLSISLLNPKATANVGGTMTFSSASTPGTYSGSVQIRGTSLLGGTATVTLPIVVTLWRALGVSQTRALNFGGLAVTGGNSVVRIDAQSSLRSVTSGGTGVNLVPSLAGNSAEFAISGNPSTSVTVTLPASASLTGPGAAMTVNNFTASPGTSLTLDANGASTLRVGASLTVGAAQAPGTYNGTYNVTVNY